MLNHADREIIAVLKPMLQEGYLDSHR